MKTETLLQEGDIIEVVTGDCVQADIPEHFAYGYRKGSFTLTHAETRVGGEQDYLAGRYVVYKTCMDGGGHGPYPGVSPDGHHVLCERLTDRAKVDFWQSGCCHPQMPDKKASGHAVRQWMEGPSE